MDISIGDGCESCVSRSDGHRIPSCGSICSEDLHSRRVAVFRRVNDSDVIPAQTQAEPSKSSPLEGVLSDYTAESGEGLLVAEGFCCRCVGYLRCSRDRKNLLCCSRDGRRASADHSVHAVELHHLERSTRRCNAIIGWGCVEGYVGWCVTLLPKAVQCGLKPM